MATLNDLVATQADLKRAEAEIERLRAALKPFADAAEDAEGYPDDHPIGCDPAMGLEHNGGEPLTVTLLRQARDQGNDVGASQCLVTLESFIGDVDGAELDNGDVLDATDAVTAINGLIWSLEQRDAEIERLRAAQTSGMGVSE